jgi:hypothetical protein
LVVESSEVWLFYDLVSYLKALFGIGIRKSPQEVLFDIRAVQAVVQVAIKVAEEYLPGGEELSEALKKRKRSSFKKNEKKRKENTKKVKLCLLLLRFEELISSFMIKLLPWELSPAIQMPGMTGRRTSEG